MDLNHNSAKAAGKPCEECGETVHTPESMWCLDCVMRILSDNTPKAINLLEAEMPLSAQLYAAGHCGVYAQTAIAGSEYTHTTVLTYLVVASDSPAVRRLAVRRAANNIVAYAALTDKNADVVQTAAAELSKRGHEKHARVAKERASTLAKSDAVYKHQKPEEML